MLEKVDQQNGTDLRKKRKTRSPFFLLPFWKAHYGGGPHLSFSRWRRCYKSRGFFPVCLASKSKSDQIPPSLAKIGDKSQQILRYSSVCPRGQSPGMAAYKCISLLYCGSRLRRSQSKLPLYSVI